MTESTQPHEAAQRAGAEAAKAQEASDSVLDRVRDGAGKVGEKIKGGLDAADDKIKDVVTDERIDKASEAIQKVTPDGLDGKVEELAEKAKEWNDQ